MMNPNFQVLSCRRLSLTIAAAGVFGAFLVSSSFLTASAQVAPSLGYAGKFAVLGGSAVTNTGATVLTGDLGISPGTTITGFPPGKIVRGLTHTGDAMALRAQTDAATAYSQLATETCNTSYSVPTELGSMTLLPGVYCFASSAQITGALTLDGGGNPNAVWVFEIGSTLTTAANSSVLFINSGQHRNVFWQIGSSATVGTGSAFQGNMLASASITLTTNATVAGSVLALNGAVTLDTNIVSTCVCTLPYAPVSATVVKTITVAPASDSIAGTAIGATLSPDGKSVWVAGYNGTATPGFVSLVDVASESVGQSIAVGAGPSDIAFTNPGGRAFVTNRYGASVSVVDVANLRVKQTIDLSSIPLQAPFGVVYKGGHVLITTQGSDNLAPEYDIEQNPITLHQAIALPGTSGRPTSIPTGMGRFGNKLLVPVFVVTNTATGAGYPELDVVNPTTAKVVGKASMKRSGSVPEAVVVSPDGKYAYVSLFNSTGGTGGVWVISLDTLSTKTVILTCDTANYGEAISADGKYLLVTGFLEDQVALIDTATDTVDVIIKGGHQPNAIALTNDNSQAFFTNQTDGTVTVVSFSPSL